MKSTSYDILSTAKTHLLSYVVEISSAVVICEIEAQGQCVVKQLMSLRVHYNRAVGKLMTNMK